MNLAEYLDLWLDTYIKPRRAENTVRAYQFAIAHLSDHVRSTMINDVSALELQREINSLAAHYERQAQIMYTALHAAFRKAAALRMVSGNPMDLVEKPAHEKAEIEILTPAEAAAYIEEARKHKAGPLLILMLCIGLRRNEARGLINSDLGEDGILRIKNQRTRQGRGELKSHASRRNIVLPEPLRAFFKGPAGEYVVDVGETQLRRQHLEVLRAIGCTDRRITLHSLRHTYGTTWAAMGFPLVSLQRAMGHAHFSVTADTYIHPDLQSIGRYNNAIFGSFHSPFMQEGARLEIV